MPCIVSLDQCVGLNLTGQKERTKHGTVMLLFSSSSLCSCICFQKVDARRQLCGFSFCEKKWIGNKGNSRCRRHFPTTYKWINLLAGMIDNSRKISIIELEGTCWFLVWQVDSIEKQPYLVFGFKSYWM